MEASIRRLANSNFDKASRHDASESVRKELLERFNGLDRVHAAYAFTRDPGESTTASHTSGLIEVYREGAVTGMYRKVDGLPDDVWFVSDGTTMVAVRQGDVYDVQPGTAALNAILENVNAAVHGLAREWNLNVEVGRHQTGLRVGVDESPHGDIEFLFSLATYAEGPAYWLEESLFKRKAVRVHESADLVVLSSGRAEMKIQRSTGLLISATAHAEGTGERLHIVRTAAKLPARMWPLKIRSILTSRGGPEVDQRPTERLHRVMSIRSGLAAIRQVYTQFLGDGERLREAARRLGNAALRTEEARADVTALVRQERELAPSREIARERIVQCWVSPLTTIRESAGYEFFEFERVAGHEIAMVLRDHAERYFDEAWPVVAAERPTRGVPEEIRKSLLRRLESLRDLHVAYDVIMTKGLDTEATPMIGVTEFFRQGPLYGALQTWRSAGIQTDFWFVTNGALTVGLGSGDSDVMPGAEALNEVLEVLQPAADALCDQLGMKRVRHRRQRTLLSLVVDESEYDMVEYRWGLGVGPGDAVTWLDGSFFAKKRVHIDEGRNQIVLSSQRAVMRIDRATGLPTSARAHKTRTGGQLRLDRREPTLGKKEWLARINEILGSTDRESMAAVKRSTRSIPVLWSLRAIVRSRPEIFPDAKSMTRPGLALVEASLDTPDVRADVAALIERDRAMSVPRAASKQNVVKAWIESIGELQADSPEGKRRVHTVAQALEQFVGKLFDEAWPDDEG